MTASCPPSAALRRALIALGSLAVATSAQALTISALSPQGEVSRVSQVEQAQGSPWVTTVTLRVETQERFNITEIANQLNHVGQFGGQQRRIGDVPLAYLQVGTQ